jgi:hypothetical protein
MLIQTVLDEASRKVLFDVHLHLSVPRGNDPIITKLLQDTESFTAFGGSSRYGYHHGARTPTDILQAASLFMMGMIENVTQLYLVVILLSTGNAAPILASVVILVLQYLVSSSSTVQDRSRKQRQARREIDVERQALFEIAGSAVYRQETNLFQIGRYLGPTWDDLTTKAMALSSPLDLNWRDGLDIAFDILMSLGPTIMKVSDLPGLVTNRAVGDCSSPFGWPEPQFHQGHR